MQPFGDKRIAALCRGICIKILNRFTICRYRSRRRYLSPFRQALEQSPRKETAQNLFRSSTKRYSNVGTSVTSLAEWTKALEAMKIKGRIQIDSKTGKASIIDVIRILRRDISSGYAAKMLNRVLQKDNRVIPLATGILHVRINGLGRKTPVCDLKTLLGVLWALPTTGTRDLQRQLYETTYRVLGGDLRLCKEIEINNYSWGYVSGGRAMQKDILSPVDFKVVHHPKRVSESSVRDCLACVLQGRTEVPTPSGFIDVLTGTEVIEAKYFRSWKGGLGQVLAYGTHFPLLKKRLHVFAHDGDEDSASHVALAKSVCTTFDVRVTFHGIDHEDTDD